MALNKVTYTDGETVIGAENLNDIQDEILLNADKIADLQGDSEDLADDVADLKSTTGTHTTQISALNTTTAGHTTQISALDSTTAGHTSQIATLSSDLETAEDDIAQSDVYRLLQAEEIPNTVQTYVKSGSRISQIVHTRGAVAVRTDSFTYGSGTITETRVLSTGENLTITTNLSTLETTVAYSAT